MLFGLAVLIPGAALAGVMVAGRRVARMVNHAPGFKKLKAKTHWPDEPAMAELLDIAATAMWAALGIALAPVASTGVDGDGDAGERRGDQEPAQRIEIWDQRLNGRLCLGGRFLDHLDVRCT